MFLFENGAYVTLAAFPLVPKNEVGFRIQVTAANTEEEVDHLIGVLTAMRERFALQQTAIAA
jgi:8-amino-7-oxononanoate synthase